MLGREFASFVFSRGEETGGAIESQGRGDEKQRFMHHSRNSTHSYDCKKRRV